MPSENPSSSRSWTFLTNHAAVLLTVAGAPDSLVEEIAAEVGITQRQTLSILRDLEEAGYLQRNRVGRRTHYTLNRQAPMRHRVRSHRQVQELLDVFVEREREAAD